MRNKIIFSLAVIGVLAGLAGAYLLGMKKKPMPPVYTPASNPYEKGIYANGIVESLQESGANINVYPEVSGTIVRIAVAEGETVQRGDALILMDDSVQRATAEQQRSQAEAALAMLNELKAQPRKENLEVAKAQVQFAQANLKNARDQFDKQKRSYELEPRSVSKDALDNAENAVKVAAANLGVVQSQYELTKAGAWIYDIKNQENQYNALSKAFLASKSLLAKYVVRAPGEGVILSINTAVGAYISPQGAYDTYTQAFLPALVMGTRQAQLGVRCYIDEILIPKLPPAPKMKATMFIRGTDITIPLEYVRVQPYVSPKIQLSNQRTERVDVRVLPVIFKFGRPKNIDVYPGQLVDVYIGVK